MKNNLLINEIKRKLGRVILDEERGSVTHLNNVPIELIHDARSLGSTRLAQELLNYYISPDCRRYLKLFIQDVVVGETLPEHWMRGRVLVPDFSLVDQLCLSRTAILTPVGGYTENRVCPLITPWQSGVSWVGSLAYSEPDSDYRSVSPPNAASLVEPKLEPVGDAVIALRRWHASRLGAYLDRAGLLDSLSSLSQISSTLLPPLVQWSEDARNSAQALLDEVREAKWIRGRIPGFCGPDHWYKDS